MDHWERGFSRGLQSLGRKGWNYLKMGRLLVFQMEKQENKKVAGQAVL